MGIVIQKPKQSIKEFVAGEIAQARRKAITILQVVGEKCINEARENGSYTDRTRNLRGSIGYVVADNGNIITEGYNENDSERGSETAKSFAHSLVSNYPDKLVLIVVAGMKYASYVEDRGYNVLISAEQLAEKQIPALLARLK